jgi:hypothetical protein
MVFLHNYFFHMLPTLGATNSKPSEYKKSTKWPPKKIIFLEALPKWIL